MGYTPAFDDIYMGTLYGKWPAAPVWATLLPLIDKNGRIDMSFQAIAGMTGWPLELLMEGIRQLMEPDPGSRSPDSDGRRLVPIDASRPWGWIAVNHGKYRERARKQRWDSERTESGKDAERKRASRGTVPDASRDVPTCPDGPRSHTQTQTHTQTEEKEDISHAERARVPSRHIEGVFRHWQTVHKHPEAKLDTKRRKLIAARLRDFSYGQLRDSIGGYRNSPHHMGQNDQGTVYDSIELILRDNKHVEMGLRFHAEPPRTDLSAQTRRIISQTEGWQPPEVRLASK